MFDKELFPCPVCGYRVHRMEPGSHGVCPICGWEDDMAQLRFVEMPGSANPVSLLEAQDNYRRLGACSRRKLDDVREPFSDETRDQSWRLYDLEKDNPEQPARGVAYADSYPEGDPTVLYYWRPNYWRRFAS